MNHKWRDNADAMVVWADKTYDRSRMCDECSSPECKSPVHEDRYRTIGAVSWEVADAEAASGYWDWMHSNQPLGAKRDHDGELVTPETLTANPDGLPEKTLRTSGVSCEQHEWMQEAYALLSPVCKTVWNLVMREQISHTEAAERLHITRQAVEKRLNAAKLIITEYLRSKQDDVA